MVSAPVIMTCSFIQSEHFHRKDWDTLTEQAANINSYSDSFHAILFSIDRTILEYLELKQWFGVSMHGIGNAYIASASFRFHDYKNVCKENCNIYCNA